MVTRSRILYQIILIAEYTSFLSFSFPSAITIPTLVLIEFDAMMIKMGGRWKEDFLI